MSRGVLGPLLAAVSAALLLTGCGTGDRGGATADVPGGASGLPGDSGSTDPYDGIASDEVLHFTGTEPFWGGEAQGTTLTYSTPEDPDGTTIAVERFAGRGGLALGGQLADQAFEMMVTPLTCSDGMSDRTYPFTITLQIGRETRNGCGWTDARPFEGPEHP